MKQLIKLTLISAVCLAGLAACEKKSHQETEIKIPAISTSPIMDVTATSASCQGIISSDGGDNITAKGLCWGTTENPSLENASSSNNGSGKESFSHVMTDLQQGTSYYVRAYATNSKGTSYGNQQSFKTLILDVPAVNTKSVMGVGANSANIGAEVTAENGAQVTERGLCWDIRENPTTALKTKIQVKAGIGPFTAEITGLSPSTTYYVRAYAVNSQGTAYGQNLTFTTTAEGGDWTQAKFYHQSLVMRFTANWCGYCPKMAQAMENAMAAMPNRILGLILHPNNSDPGLAFSGTSTLMSAFQVKGYPTGIVDFRAEIPNYQDIALSKAAFMEAVQESLDHFPPQSGIAVKTTLNGHTLHVDIALRLKKAGDYKLNVVVLESGMTSTQNGYAGTYVNHDVARVFLTELQGNDVKAAQNGSLYTANYSTELKSSWKTDNCSVLVYVQTKYDNNRVTGVGKVNYPNYGEFYVDNACSVSAGSSLDFKYEL